MLFSLAVTANIGHDAGCESSGYKLDFIDVRRAYFHAKARRLVYVALPEEDGEENMCGRLEKALYGTRDAAHNWEHSYVDFLGAVGIKSGRATPCIFYHGGRDIRVVVHGDDFIVLAAAVNLDRFRRQIAKRFEVKFRGRLGPEQKDDTAIRILTRVISWTSDGLEYEADQWHAEINLQQLGLSKLSKAVNTPSVKMLHEDERLLSKHEATIYRAMVARAKYLAQDRADIGFTVKELCRHMSAPRKADQETLKRLGRYLPGKARVVSLFEYQEQPDTFEAVVDTDHAGCLRTRKSTSGGAVMFGKHCLKTWSVNQQVIALSSGEAEYYGMVKGASNTLGLAGMLSDMNVNVGVCISTDSSAAKSIGSRRGLGKVRHNELAELWLQEQIARGKIQLRKIRGDENFSDSLTKHATADRIAQTTAQKVARGRHAIMPEVAH